MILHYVYKIVNNIVSCLIQISRNGINLVMAMFYMLHTQSKHNHVIQIIFRIVLYSTYKFGHCETGAQTHLYFTSDWMWLWLQNLC